MDSVANIDNKTELGTDNFNAKKRHSDLRVEEGEQLTFYKQLDYGTKLKYQDDIFGRHESTRTHSNSIILVR